LFKDYKDEKQKVVQKIKHICRNISLDDQAHSPHRRGENLLQQLYVCDELQYESSSEKPGVPIDSHHRHHRKEEKESTHIKSYKVKFE
jgi:hypothetical protein